MIKKDDNVYQVLDRYPELADVFGSFGLTCIGCPGSAMESIEDAAMGHDVDVDALLEKINERLK